MKKSPLIFMNGRWNNGKDHIYICAKNIADAIRIIQKLDGHTHYTDQQLRYEITKYFNMNAWGNAMKDIIPERGAWVTTGYPTESKPVKVA